MSADARIDMAMKAAVALLLALAAWSFNDLKSEVRALSTRITTLEINNARIEFLDHRITELERKKP